jgi:hypothetical protein
MTADNTRGVYAGRVYVFYNESTRDAKGAYHTQIRLLYSDDGGKTLKGPAVPALPEGSRLRGSFPTQSKVLSNGAAIAVFIARHESVLTPPGPPQNTTEVVISDDGGKALSAPVQIMARIGTLACRSDPTMAVDESKGPFAGRIYVAEANASAGCQVALSSSSDNGKTWSKPTLVTVDSAGALLNLSIGVNRDGVIGLAWAEKEGDCWRFSASTDGGASFQPSVPVSPCALNSTPSLQLLNQSLWAISLDDRNARNGISTAFSMRAPLGVVWKTNMAVSSDGLFHPIWMDTQGQIWTAAVSVGEDLSRKSLPTLADLADVSSEVIFDLANNHFDATTGIVSVDVGIMSRTTAKAALRGPLVMQITDLHSEFGKINVLSSDNGESGAGALFDMTDLLPPDPLAPGASSLRRRILFHISEPKLPSGVYPDLVIVKAKVFAKPASKK